MREEQILVVIKKDSLLQDWRAQLHTLAQLAQFTDLKQQQKKNNNLDSCAHFVQYWFIHLNLLNHLWCYNKRSIPLAFTTQCAGTMKKMTCILLSYFILTLFKKKGKCTDLFLSVALIPVWRKIQRRSSKKKSFIVFFFCCCFFFSLLGSLPVRKFSASGSNYRLFDWALVQKIRFRKLSLHFGLGWSDCASELFTSLLWRSFFTPQYYLQYTATQ